MVVQVAAVRALLDVAVLGEILHADSHVHHRLAAVFAVEASLKKKTEEKVGIIGMDFTSCETHLSRRLITAPQRLAGIRRSASAWSRFLSRVMSGPLTLGGPPPHIIHIPLSRAPAERHAMIINLKKTKICVKRAYLRTWQRSFVKCTTAAAMNLGQRAHVVSQEISLHLKSWS